MENYILRIPNDDLEKYVFALKSYYVGIRREWKPNAKVLLIKKIELGDAFLGYAVIKNVTDLEEMSGEEKKMCINKNWSKKLSLAKVVRFEPPVLLKDTLVSRWSQKGALLHCTPISESYTESIAKIAGIKIVS